MYELTIGRRTEQFDDVQPQDKPMCRQFGAGAFPCGRPYRVQVLRVTTVQRGESRTQVRRRVLCRAHYEFFISNVKGGAGGLKSRAMHAAYEELAAAHLAEFQQTYERHVARLIRDEAPDLDPALVLPNKES